MCVRLGRSASADVSRRAPGTSPPYSRPKTLARRSTGSIQRRVPARVVSMSITVSADVGGSTNPLSKSTDAVVIGCWIVTSIGSPRGSGPARCWRECRAGCVVPGASCGGRRRGGMTVEAEALWRRWLEVTNEAVRRDGHPVMIVDQQRSPISSARSGGSTAAQSSTVETSPIVRRIRRAGSRRSSRGRSTRERPRRRCRSPRRGTLEAHATRHRSHAGLLPYWS